MIDINRIIRDREAVEAALRKRMDGVDFGELIDWYEQRKAIKIGIDEKKHQRKTLSAEISKLLKAGEDAEETKSRVKQLAEDITADEVRHAALDERIHDHLAQLPNIPEEEVPAGGKENNEPLEYLGEKPEPGFEIRDHVELATSLGLVDFERGTKMGGRGKWLYWGDGALLEWGLLNYFTDRHRRCGYTMVLPPHLLRLESGYVAGQFPKFADDVFYVGARDDGPDDRSHFLLPTSETALANLYAGEVIPEDELPIELFAYTPCYRKEAGAYRTKERGTIRGNQFNKVELFSVAKPEQSEAQFQKILAGARELMDGLGLHYRVTRLAAEDCSESMAKTYDLEVWLPSIEEYKEVSSVSSAHTFQSLRGNIRYRDKAKGKNFHVHTLNGSGLATSRVLPAILEQYQQADGSVRVPDVLQPYVGKDVFAPKA